MIMSRRIVICGSRDWNDFQTIKNYLEKICEQYKSTDITIIHGGCKGADSIAGYLAKQLKMNVIVYKADWIKYGKSAGPKRNQQMLDEGKPDYVIAFHNDINNSKGTLDMITRAKKNNIPIEIYNST